MAPCDQNIYCLSYKIQRSYLSWHWIVMHNLKKSWLVVWKKTWEIWQSFTRALESVKMGLWWDPFLQSRKDMTLKLTEKLCVMAMKNNAKFEEEFTWHFKTDLRNLTNFDSSNQRSKKLLFNWLLWPMHIMFELRKVQGIYVW